MPRGMSPRAARAYQAYLALGEDRSLEKLAAWYADQQPGSDAVGKIPLRTLFRYSATWHWPDRVRALADQEAAAAERAYLARRAAVMAEGLALDYERTRSLKELAGAALQNAAVLLRTQQDASGRPRAIRGDDLADADVSARLADKLLAAIAAETGGRVKRVAIERDLLDWAREYGAQQGLTAEEAVRIAQDVLGVRS